MSKLIIEGGNPLKGTVRLGGAKNASFKLMIASLLTCCEVRLLNMSNIKDVHTTKKIITSLGGKIAVAGERSLSINCAKLKNFRISPQLSKESRASTMFIGPLLARFGRAFVALPGGDKIGPRPLDRHIEGLKKLGVNIKKRNNFLIATGTLKGGNYTFPKNSHTGTETLLMAAVCAKGKTVLGNAAQEPEVDELINFLNGMGAHIKRNNKREIEIEGTSNLRPIVYKIMPDRNEAVSYAIAALITKGDIVVENAIKEHLETFLEKLKLTGAGIQFGNYGIRFYYKGKLKPVDITTKPHPGFMTDWQPLWAVLATQSYGTTRIIESVYLNRFNYVKNLISMGAKIAYFNPDIKNPDSFYNFNLVDSWDKLPHGIEIKGPSMLSSVVAKIPDLRAGATLVLAGLIANSKKTILENIYHIDRGYEDLDGRLKKLGAKITRV